LVHRWFTSSVKFNKPRITYAGDTAILVESVRVDGRPRQRHIACLGSITESPIEVDHQRRYFWDAIYDQLDRLRIAIADRRKIEMAIELKVPRLSRNQHEASIAELQNDRMFFADGVPEALMKPYRPPTPVPKRSRSRRPVP
jgi:hypothetical protein